MNNTRRKNIQNVINKLENLKSDIEMIRDEEQDYIDNMPENLEGSMRHDMAEEAVDNLESAIDSLEEVIDSLSEATL